MVVVVIVVVVVVATGKPETACSLLNHHTPARFELLVVLKQKRETNKTNKNKRRIVFSLAKLTKRIVNKHKANQTNSKQTQT